MLHIIYRSYGGENMKKRPQFYSKMLTLCSLVRAYSEIKCEAAELIYLNDGPIPENRLRIMESTGEIISKSSMGNAGSIRAALKLSTQRGWSDEDLVWFAEDDYLYLPKALNELIAAGQNIADADYFGLHALIGNRQPSGLPHIDSRVPARKQENDKIDINGHAWRVALSTTSTFGARVRAIRSDRKMMNVAIKTGGAWDHTTCLVYQGFEPFPHRFLIESVQQATGPVKLARAGALAAIRSAYSLYFRLWQKRSVLHKLVAADPALICHLEIDNLALGTDWSVVAEDVSRWASQVGYAIPAAVSS